MNWLINALASMAALTFVAAYGISAVVSLWRDHGERQDVSQRSAGPQRVTDKEIRQILGGRSKGGRLHTDHLGGKR